MEIYWEVIMILLASIVVIAVSITVICFQHKLVIFANPDKYSEKKSQEKLINITDMDNKLKNIISVGDGSPKEDVVPETEDYYPQTKFETKKTEINKK